MKKYRNLFLPTSNETYAQLVKYAIQETFIKVTMLWYIFDVIGDLS